jgi:hypothetical protein
VSSSSQSSSQISLALLDREDEVNMLHQNINNTSEDANLHQHHCQNLKLSNMFILPTPWNDLQCSHYT